MERERERERKREREREREYGDGQVRLRCTRSSREPPAWPSPPRGLSYTLILSLQLHVSIC